MLEPVLTMAMLAQFYEFDVAPSTYDFKRALVEQLGSVGSFDGFEIQGSVAIVTFSPDFLTGAYIDRVAHSFGGVRVDFATKQPRPELPWPFTARPWRSYGVLTRFAIRFKIRPR